MRDRAGKQTQFSARGARGAGRGARGAGRENRGQWLENSGQWSVASECEAGEIAVIEKRQNGTNCFSGIDGCLN